jgi:hypothetical protein
MSRMLRLFVVMILAAGPAFAQGAGPDAKTKTDAAKGKSEARSKEDAQAKPAPAPPAPTTNIRIELTITDQRGTAAPVSKIITMTMVDNGFGRIRTGGDVRTPLGFRPVTLNVDAQPRGLRDGKIRVDLTIEYRPTAAESDTEQSTTPTINESIAVLLEDGKSVLISQSADPATDRKVKVEVKATILK